MFPFVDPTTPGPAGSSTIGFIISASCAGVATIIGSVAMIGRRKQQVDPENSTVRIRERLTAVETHQALQDRDIDEIKDEVRLYRAVQVADEQQQQRPGGRRR